MQYIVQPGDCLSSIAQKHGFGNWRIIYNDPNNADFRLTRPNPNLIYADDILFIPDKKPKEIEIPTASSSVFIVNLVRTHLRLRIVNLNDEPRGGLAYKLRVGSLQKEGTTSADGMIDEEIPADVTSGALEIASIGVSKSLQIGHLDPIDTISGIQGRLKNLGYDCGPIDGIKGRKTTAAIRAFQRDNSPLEVDGICGPKTKAILTDRHGC